MTALRSRICVMQIPRTKPTKNYSQARPTNFAPLRGVLSFVNFSLDAQRKVGKGQIAMK